MYTKDIKCYWNCENNLRFKRTNKVKKKHSELKKKHFEHFAEKICKQNGNKRFTLHWLKFSYVNININIEPKLCTEYIYTFHWNFRTIASSQTIYPVEVSDQNSETIIQFRTYNTETVEFFPLTNPILKDCTKLDAQSLKTLHKIKRKKIQEQTHLYVFPI